MDEISEETQKSKYNSGLIQLQRIDSLWGMANSDCKNESPNKWNTDLDLIWAELSSDLKPTSNFIKEYVDLDKKIGTIIETPKQTFNPISSQLKDAKLKQYKSLMSKHIFLKRLQNATGKGTKYDEGDDEEAE